MELTSFEETILQWLDGEWICVIPANRIVGRYTYQYSPEEKLIYEAHLAEAISRLQGIFTSQEITQFACQSYFDPFVNRFDNHLTVVEKNRRQFTETICKKWLDELADQSEILHHIKQTYQLVFAVEFPAFEKPYDDKTEYELANFDKVNKVLQSLPLTADVLDYFEYLLTNHPNKINEDGELVRISLVRSIVDIRDIEKLYQHNRLTYELFKKIITCYPSFIVYLTHRLIDKSEELTTSNTSEGQTQQGLRPDSIQQMAIYLEHFAQELVENIDLTNAYLLSQFKNLQGSQWLLHALNIHQQFSDHDCWKYQLNWQSDTDTECLLPLIIHLARTPLKDISSLNEQISLVKDLKPYSADTLKYVLPVARYAREYILQALAWENVLPLVQLITQYEEYGYGLSSNYSAYIPHSARDNALQLDYVDSILHGINQEQLNEVLRLFNTAQIGVDGNLLLIEAYLGRNTAEIKKSVKHRKQTAIKAYGLLPIESDDDVLERYQYLKQFQKESKRWGPDRQANEIYAVEEALHYLAQLTGYSTSEQLTWALEIQLAAHLYYNQISWKIEDYSLEIQIQGVEPNLIITRNERTLKSIPKIVRKSEVYPEVKAIQNDMREQVRRFRQTFEYFMTMSKIFSKSDLANLQNIPVATALLANLVLCTETGIMGLYDAENMAVLTLGGDIVPIHEHVLIAHSYHLYHEDCLSDWQHAIVDREIVQPFKQVFRELYLLTPAEEETGTYSSRFAGHVINPVIALKLFQTNNWQASRGIHTLPHKVFREQKIEAQFEFDDLQRYFHPNETSLTGLISFHPYAVQPPARNLETIRLIDVPPLIFSEVMRDADLVVSVAGTGEQQQSSAEIIMARVNLLSALLQSLKLTNLHIEGHFAYIKGKLANYRIHLGSAVIHIEPGNYLCIVPAEWKPSTTLYLPFADDNDRKTSEVISKVFMLLRDDKITDKSILAQIKRHQP